MNLTYADSVEDLRQRAKKIIKEMSEEQAALALRVLMLGDEATDALLASDCRGYNNVLAFVNEYEKETR